MNKEYSNKSIECSIENCANHCGNDKYCALKKINVGAHSAGTGLATTTDCKSCEQRSESMIY